MPNYLVDPPPPFHPLCHSDVAPQFPQKRIPLNSLDWISPKCLLSVLNTLNSRLTNRPTSTKINPCMQVSDDNQQSHSSVFSLFFPGQRDLDYKSLTGTILFLQELWYSWTLKIEFKFFEISIWTVSFLRTSTATTSFRTKHLSTYCTQTDHFKTSITN